MKKFITQRGLLFSVVSTTLFLLQACATPIGLKQQSDDALAGGCTMTSTKKLEIAMDDAKARLSSGACNSSFDTYYDELLQVAKGYPKPDNSSAFKDYLRWAVNQGYVSKVQAENRYERYFSFKYTTLDSKRSTAASVCPDLDGTMAKLRAELENKKTGLLEVNDSADKYKKAQQLYFELELNLEAICSAVADSRA